MALKLSRYALSQGILSQNEAKPSSAWVFGRTRPAGGGGADSEPLPNSQTLGGSEVGEAANESSR